MNTYKFIALNGLEKARTYLNFGAPFSLAKITLENGTVILADDIKQAIADFEFVSKCGGIKTRWKGINLGEISETMKSDYTNVFRFEYQIGEVDKESKVY
ncbi:hypothetical protein [Acinetobacter rathckeae]|uniref:hypothetical protein n=1 Tax=Acinetobacter rathckeae TaxID=2605272 RepID=UPI0018A3373E|nr:hypothetical protein [Acinetobacter rathckeae]MBF7687713.1 hypothetical protein [Acinetobacter rathckeae]MBF7688064.1 hypothetical protein [Acinetobacter rathckeae]